MKNLFYRSKEIISQTLDLQDNVLLGHPLVEFEGRKKLRIENHKGIVKYTSDEIMVNTTLGTIIISGEGMNIISLFSEEIIIKGQINGVRYLV